VRPTIQEPDILKTPNAYVKKYGEDPTRWASVSKYLILKAKKQYYNDPVFKRYYPGSHTVKYVEQIWERFSSYKAISKNKMG
jgi:membrane-bound lytic murein transglycosylase F